MVKSDLVARQLSSCSAVGVVALLLASCGPTDRSTDPPSIGKRGLKTAEYELDPSLPIERSIAPGESHLYDLGLKEGEFVELSVEQRGVDVVLRLFDPEGELLLEADLPIADLGRETLTAVAGNTGSHRVEVEAWDSETGEGSYLASLEIRPADDRDRLRAEAANLFYEAERRAWDRNFEDAVAFYEGSLDLWRRVGDSFWQAETLDRRGAALRSMGARRQAIEAWNKASKLFDSIGEVRFAAISQYGVAGAYFQLGEMDLALKHYQRSLVLRQLAQDPRGEALALAGIAEVYKVLGETQEALDHFLRARSLLDGSKDGRYLGNLLHNLGTLYRRIGKREAALDNLRAAAKIFADLSLPRRQASSLSQIGQLELELGDPESALLVLAEALALRRQAGDLQGQATVLRKIGTAYLARGDTENTRVNYEQALGLLRETDAPRSMALALSDLGALHGQLGEDALALENHSQALLLFNRIGDPIGQTRALLGVASSERSQGRLSEASETAGRALEIAEALRIKPLSEDLRLSFFSTVQRLFDLYIEILMEMHQQDNTKGYGGAALQASERARARSLLDLLTEAVAEIRDDAAPDLLAQEGELQKLLNRNVELMEDETAAESVRQRAAKDVRNALERLDAIRTAIRRQSPRYAALTQPQTLSLSDIQSRVLDPDTLLLEYRLGTDRSYLWLVSTDSLTSFELPSAQAIEATVRRAHALLKRSHRREAEMQTQSLLCELSRQLLSSVAGKLARKRLAIVANGALQYLPFAALPDPDSDRPCAEALPLVAAHEIVYLPSASALRVLREERSHRSPAEGLLAVIADPVFSSDDPRIKDTAPEAPADPSRTRSKRLENGIGVFRRLPYSRTEARAILDLVPARGSFSAVDFEASKETVFSGRLAGYRFLHFATHGILNAEKPALSGVVLSQVDRAGRPVDGFLRAHEIYSLDLPSELVVLGACETALGKDVKGEGLIGLARGFMYAGASRVMVSLWKVSDRGTADLMTSFYRGLLEKGLAPTAALRAAQLEVRQRSPQPFYWAGFVVQGEWRPATFD